MAVKKKKAKKKSGAKPTNPKLYASVKAEANVSSRYIQVLMLMLGLYARIRNVVVDTHNG